MWIAGFHFKAAGLLIVPSNKPFRYDIRNASGALRSDPADTQAVHDAIAMRRDGLKRQSALSGQSPETAKPPVPADRTERVLLFIRRRTERETADGARSVRKEIRIACKGRKRNTASFDAAADRTPA